MKANERTKKKQTRILLATITANEYATMDTNGDNRVSPLEFLCSTLLRQVRDATDRLSVWRFKMDLGSLHLSDTVAVTVAWSFWRASAVHDPTTH